MSIEKLLKHKDWKKYDWEIIKKQAIKTLSDEILIIKTDLKTPKIDIEFEETVYLENTPIYVYITEIGKNKYMANTYVLQSFENEFFNINNILHDNILMPKPKNKNINITYGIPEYRFSIKDFNIDIIKEMCEYCQNTIIDITKKVGEIIE